MSNSETTSLKQILEDAAKMLKSEFDEIRKNSPHYGDAGGEAEDILKKFLRDRLPRRFDAEGGHVVGIDEQISLQTDIIVFDALNCPLYRRTKQSCIVPRDNVAAVIEVKSKLSKEELKDAAKKVASAKKMKASPLGGLDQPVNFANIVATNMLGCVFAYESATSLETLADNLKEINAEIDSDHWIDMVVVLDKGMISYSVQYPMAKKFPGMFGGSLVNDVVAPPVYVHLVVEESASRSLNQFYVRLMSQLSVFRQRSSIPFEAALGKELGEIKTIQGYQFNLKSKLVQAEESHQKSSFVNPKVRFNLYDGTSGNFLGQICLWPWQDGASISYSGHVEPANVFAWLGKHLKSKPTYFLNVADQGSLLCSNLISVSEQEFSEAVSKLHPKIVVQRDSQDDNPPPFKIDIKPK